MPKREPIDPGKYSFPTLMNDIENGRVRLPTFQREFVWSPGKVIDLVDSVYKGYPIGSLAFDCHVTETWMIDVALDSIKEWAVDVASRSSSDRKALAILDRRIDDLRRVREHVHAAGASRAHLLRRIDITLDVLSSRAGSNRKHARS
jgi:hypothetical protein